MPRRKGNKAGSRHTGVINYYSLWLSRYVYNPKNKVGMVLIGKKPLAFLKMSCGSPGNLPGLPLTVPAASACSPPLTVLFRQHPSRCEGVTHAGRNGSRTNLPLCLELETRPWESRSQTGRSCLLIWSHELTHFCQLTVYCL